ncbi:sulfonate transport system permease protein [Herbaspirillum sp. Sphag1AN]|uniref:ABC transporter permease n=1 Tax=unclassified Herbaspirillum TaxID=2624150 RepID=UPI001609AEE4|nr:MULTISPECIES: ABC transporter permease subunit [unclassified Herbaspirillum]MBB3213456.1 sulfonate transport system permease protein [Herbaspirillum sp. Sphag1AN]MBB3246500.1 sulfonate transport system permease protein [Herbaspirillum sp. Sphag64]
MSNITASVLDAPTALIKPLTAETSGWQQRWLRALLRRATSPLVIVLLWELASRTGVLPDRILAAPSQIASTFATLVASGEMGSNLLVSLGRVLTGLSISLTIGTGLALIAGLSRRGEFIVDAPMQMVRTLPFVGLVPLFIVWFGIGDFTKISLIAFATTFPMYLTLYSGIRSIDAKLIEAGRLFGLGHLGLIWHVVLPGALPSFLLGLRYALGVSWLSLVIVEQINATAGIGYLINNARDFMRTDIIVVCLMVYSLLGLLTDVLVRGIEQVALAWRPSFIKD